MDFTGRVALITGAGKGIGRAYAEWLGAHGAKVVVNNRSHPGVPSSAQEVADVITRAGGTAIIDEHAVEDEASGQAMVEAALKAFGRLDILICNAGVSAQKKAVEDATLAEFDEIMRINFYGALHPLKAALPGMIANNYGRGRADEFAFRPLRPGLGRALRSGKNGVGGSGQGNGHRESAAQREGECRLALCTHQHGEEHRSEVF
jgi:NAD(P)-dependent dehydrogenase (short-subunit alcohol dehydrogenase family)